MGNTKGSGSRVVSDGTGTKVSLDEYILDQDEEDRVRQLLAPILTQLNLSLFAPIRIGVTASGEMTISGLTVTASPVTATY